MGSLQKVRLTSDVAKFSRYMDSAASTAPPPITTVLDSSTRRTTHSASCMERSISSHMKSFAPRSIIDAAERLFGLRHKVKVCCVTLWADTKSIKT